MVYASEHIVWGELQLLHRSIFFRNHKTRKRTHTQHVYVSNYRLRFVYQTVSMMIMCDMSLILHSNKVICGCVCGHTSMYVRVYVCAYKGWWVHPFSSASKHTLERSLSIAPLSPFLSIYLNTLTSIHTRMRIRICTYVHTYKYCKYVSVRMWHVCMGKCFVPTNCMARCVGRMGLVDLILIRVDWTNPICMCAKCCVPTNCMPGV